MKRVCLCCNQILRGIELAVLYVEKKERCKMAVGEEGR